MAKLKRFLRKASFLLATSPSSSFSWPRAFFPSPSHGGPPPARTTRYFSPASKMYMKATSSSRTPSNLLAQVRCHSQVILDTADYLQLAHLPGTLEVTTNPSIVWQAAQKEEYFHLLEEACNMYLPLGIDGIPDMLEAVPPKFAREIWKRLPHAPSSSSLPLPRVYVQLDPRYAFDIDLAVRQSLALVDLCVHKHQLPLSNLVIKIPGSWEGIQAAKDLRALERVFFDYLRERPGV
ncbi:transaldolase [Nannochloropsis gaditana]|uniref:Transaldolase n=1 Tax=Nannochloropsis gaditana TaxID=72520 RepID=W7TLQ3_9STRA|nr:transaldolase [Nannochloropsis gaditana]